MGSAPGCRQSSWAPVSSRIVAPLDDVRWLSVSECLAGNGSAEMYPVEVWVRWPSVWPGD